MLLPIGFRYIFPLPPANAFAALLFMVKHGKHTLRGTAETHE